MSRIAATFSALKKQKRAALITYIMAGDTGSEELLHALPEAGADIIELGFPFSDPMADGKTIQAAAGRALENGMTLQKTLGMVKTFRTSNNTTPIVLMGYYNPVLHYGLKAFVSDAVKSGVDGLLLVDLPPEEDDELFKLSAKQGLDLIKLATPTTNQARAKVILKKASGFLYYVSLTGITGAKSVNTKHVEKSVEALKKQSKLPIAVGFGIKTAAQVREIAGFSDAVVVGSALVDALQKGKDKALQFVQELRAALQP